MKRTTLLALVLSLAPLCHAAPDAGASSPCQQRADNLAFLLKSSLVGAKSNVKGFLYVKVEKDGLQISAKGVQPFTVDLGALQKYGFAVIEGEQGFELMDTQSRSKKCLFYGQKELDSALESGAKQADEYNTREGRVGGALKR